MPAQTVLVAPRAGGVIAGKIVVVQSAAHLTATYARLSDHLSLMVQEIIPGGDDHLFGYLAFWDADGREVAWVTKQKLRQFPPGFGDGTLQRTVDAPDVRALSVRLLQTFGWRGLVGVEFKRDMRDASLRLMEVNPRTVAANQVAVTAGVDLPWIAYQYNTGMGVSAPAGFRTGVQLVNEPSDLRACLRLQGRTVAAFATWLRSIRASEAKALGARDDPWPLLIAMGRFAVALLTGSERTMPAL
ncbi:MAG: ATP-grasp domain-containing protein [Armatimonadota bacterium]|nr:ATP-grasp domain-containing protein [Armatimonadota bacterium]